MLHDKLMPILHHIPQLEAQWLRWCTAKHEQGCEFDHDSGNYVSMREGMQKRLCTVHHKEPQVVKIDLERSIMASFYNLLCKTLQFI